MVKHKNHTELLSYLRSRRIWLIFVFGGLTAFAPLTIDMYLPAFPTMMDELHTSTSLIQLSLTATLMGIAFGQLVVGPISDVHGRRKPLIIALAVYIVVSLLCAVASSISILIALRFIQGAAGAAGIVIARACVRDIYSGSEMTKFFSFMILVMGAAPILAPIIGGQLLYLVPWQGIFVALGLIGLIMLLAVTFGLPDSLSKDNRSAGGFMNTVKTFRSLVGNRFFLGHALPQGLIMGSMFAYIAGSSFVLQEIFGLSPQVYSLLFGVNAAGFMISALITGRLASKIGEAKIFVLGIGVALTGGLLLLFSILLETGLVSMCIAFFLCVYSIGMVNTSGISLAMQSQGKNAGSASALLGLLQYLFGAIAAPLVGLGGSLTALPLGIVIISCQIGAMAIYFFLVVRAKKLSH